MKRLRRAILYTVLLLAVVGTASAYLWLYVFTKRGDYASVRGDIRSMIDLGDASTANVERGYAYYNRALRAAEDALTRFADPLKSFELENLREEAERKKLARWEILHDRWMNMLRFVQRRQLAQDQSMAKADKEMAEEQQILNADQTYIEEEMMRAVYIVEPEDVWDSYLKVLTETLPAPDSPLYIVVRLDELPGKLREINAQRRAKKLEPVKAHYFGDVDTIDVDPVDKVPVFKFGDAKLVELYEKLYSSPPEELVELDLMRLRYVHRAVREHLELQVASFAQELRPVSGLSAVGRDAYISESERAKIEKMIAAEIEETLRDGRLAQAVANRAIQWSEALPPGLVIKHEIIWPAVERLLEERKAMDVVLNRLRGIILRPLRKYPDGQKQCDLYVVWLKQQQIIFDETQKSGFLLVKRWRPIDIYFNTPDGYVIISFFLPPKPPQTVGWRADCAVLLRQEFDTAWLPIGFQTDGPYVKEWRETEKEE